MTYLILGQDKKDKQKVIARAIEADNPEEALKAAKQIAVAIWDIYPLDSNKAIAL